MDRISRITWLALGMAAIALPASAAAADDKLAQDKQCFACHSVAKDGAAPSFRKIAARYKGQKDGEARMVATVLGGSQGKPHWNKATMPDQAERPTVSEAEAKTLVKWVLAQ